MGLVDDHQIHRGLLGKVQKFRGQQTLWGHVDDLIHSGPGVAQGLLILGPGEGAVEVGPPHAVLHQSGDLVFHQGNQRRHHQRNAGQQQGRHLKAQGFPCAGGHNTNRVLTGQQGVDHLFLAGPKGGISKIAFQNLQFCGHTILFSHRSIFFSIAENHAQEKRKTLFLPENSSILKKYG